MKKTLLFLCFLLYATLSFAKGGKDSAIIALEKMMQLADSFNNAMKWEHGTINLANGIAKLEIPQGFKFLNATQSQYILEYLWGNLKDNSVLGMIFPEEAEAFEDSSWAYVITFDEMGYVKDEDADDINYDNLLKDQKEESAKANEERRILGMNTLNLVGWAQAPFYDKTNKLLHWAKEYHSAESDENTLNYDIRILGRKGILSINAVAGMSKLSTIKANSDKVIKMASFTNGNQYKDYDSKVDKVAAWTIGGLVAGKLLAKAGLGVLLLKYIKLIGIGIVAVGGGIWRFITGRKKTEA